MKEEGNEVHRDGERDREREKIWKKKETHLGAMDRERKPKKYCWRQKLSDRDWQRPKKMHLDLTHFKLIPYKGPLMTAEPSS